MDRCPLCRATLNGSKTCRRCRAELGVVRGVARRSRNLAGEAMRRLARDEMSIANRLLRRALVLHATPDIQALARLVATALQQNPQTPAHHGEPGG